MSPKDVSNAYQLDADLAAPSKRIVPEGLFHIGPGKAVAALMVLGDVLALVAAFVIGTWLSDMARDVFLGAEGFPYGIFGPRGDKLGVLIVLMVGVFGFGGLYQRDGWETEETKRLIAGVALVALFDALLAYATKDHFSRLWFVLAWPIAMLLVVSMRMSLRSLPFVERMMTTHMVILGSGMDREEFAYQLRESRSGRIEVHGGLPIGALPTLSLHDLESWLDRKAAEIRIKPEKLQTVIVPSPEEQRAAQSLTDRLATLQRPSFVTVSYEGLVRRGLNIHKIVGSDMLLAGVTPERTAWVDRGLKRLLDILVTGLGVILISPLLLGIAIALLLEGGPIFFSQIRVGRDRKRFNCLKFRSMRPDAEERLAELLTKDPAARTEWETHQKLTNDPRITPIGRFLRATSFDELPQLFNVLLGDMSLVGPRPICAPEVPGYDSDHSYYASPQFRYYTRCVPGITGLWQVSGRHSTAHEERVRLDRWYARNWSIWLDLAILFKTFRAVVGRSGG